MFNEGRILYERDTLRRNKNNVIYLGTALFFHLFCIFNTHYKFYNKYVCEKCPSNIWCRDMNLRPLEHEPPPITSRPKGTELFQCCKFRCGSVDPMEWNTFVTFPKNAERTIPTLLLNLKRSLLFFFLVQLSFHFDISSPQQKCQFINVICSNEKSCAQFSSQIEVKRITPKRSMPIEIHWF